MYSFSHAVVMAITVDLSKYEQQALPVGERKRDYIHNAYKLLHLRC